MSDLRLRPSNWFSSLILMRILRTAISVTLGLSGFSALAAEDVDFKPSGEFRVRYFNDVNSTGLGEGVTPGTGQKADTTARLTTNLLARKGETLQVFGSFVYNVQLGANNSDDGQVGSGPRASTAENDSLLVSRAWGLWKMTNSVIMKVGRFGLQFGDGTMFSENTWERVPTAHDGMDLLWDVDVVKLHLLAVKTHEYSLESNLGATGTGPVVSTSNDPERNFYGVNADVRNLPIGFKSVNFLALQVNSDPVADGTSSHGRDSWQHFGVSLAGGVSQISYRLSGAFQTGRIGIFTPTDNNGTALPFTANMVDFDLTYTVPDWLGFHVTLGGHRDSGDHSATASSEYQPLYYDRHEYSGLMDLVGWGNITYGDLVLAIVPREDFEIGLGTYLFSRTQNATGITFGDRFASLAAAQAKSPSDFANSRALVGTEFDLYATRTFEANFKMDAHAALFVPGAYLRDGALAHNQTLAEGMVEATLPF